MFDFKSIQDFDKHINLSIPSYKNLSNVELAQDDFEEVSSSLTQDGQLMKSSAMNPTTLEDVPVKFTERRNYHVAHL